MKTMKRWLLLAILLLLPSVAYSQARFDVCRVHMSWWNPTKGQGSSNMLLGEFQTTIGEEPTVRLFRDEDSGLVVNVGVQYEYEPASGSSPYALRLALAVAKTEVDAFEVFDKAIAGASYGKHWGSLYVEQQAAVGPLEYTFTLVCEDGNRRRKLSRHR